MDSAKILLIEDEKNIVELVRYNVEREGFRLVVAWDGEDGLAAAGRERPDLILLDLLLPKLNGMEVCRRLRQSPQGRRLPIIMLTAKAEEADKVLGLELGADDYVTKPFSPRELVARIRAVLRGREAAAQAPDQFRCGALEADWERHTVTLQGKPVHLTPREYDLLKVLAQANGRALSRDVLLERVWGYDHASEIETRTVDFHVSQLRRKLKGESHRLMTVPGNGYRFAIEGGRA